MVSKLVLSIFVLFLNVGLNIGLNVGLNLVGTLGLGEFGLKVV